MPSKPTWDECCVVCGGPPAFERFEGAAGLNLAATGTTRWLSDWVGVTPEHPEQPRPIGAYAGSGCFGPAPSDSRSGIGANRYSNDDDGKFATFTAWDSLIRPAEEKHEKEHGPPGACDCGAATAAAAAAATGEAAGDDDEWQGFVQRPPCPATAPEPDPHWLCAWRWGEGGWVRYGVAFHRACGEVLQQRLGYALNFNQIWPLLLKQRKEKKKDEKVSSCLRMQNYGGAGSYHNGMHFKQGCLTPADEYMLLDPRLCSSNADRIVRVWEPLVKQFLGQPPTTEQPAGVGGKDSSSRGNGGSRSRGISTGAAAVTSSGIDAGSAGQTPGPTSAMQALALTNTGTNPLQLAISHAHSNQQQLELTAQLLPVCSSMPQLLSSSLQLEVVANTARRAIAFAEWLRKYGDVLNSLDLDAAVDCCTKDARDCSQAVAGALSTAANTNQALRLTSFTGHVVDDSDAEHLLLSLPLSHTTSLRIGGAWQLSAAGAQALAAATALHTLRLPGAGLAASLTAPNSSLAAVLATSLQRLSLTDAGCCSAADLRALSQQLTALTELQLTYHPLTSGAERESYIALVPDLASGGWLETLYSRFVPEVWECWAELPALRSLELGPRKVPYEEAFNMGQEEGPGACKYWPRAPERLQLNSSVLSSLAALTHLTNLCLGPSSCLCHWGPGDGAVGGGGGAGAAAGGDDDDAGSGSDEADAEGSEGGGGDESGSDAAEAEGSGEEENGNGEGEDDGGQAEGAAAAAADGGDGAAAADASDDEGGWGMDEDEDINGPYDYGLKLLKPHVRAWTGLHKLSLTMRCPNGINWENDAHRAEVMSALASLPKLQDLTVLDAVYTDQELQLSAAPQLTRVEFVRSSDTSSGGSELQRFRDDNPEVQVVADELSDESEPESDLESHSESDLE